MMDKPQDRKLRVFAEALALSDPAERARYLDEACGDDAELRQRVETLLRAHEQAGDFLEPTVPVATPKSEPAEHVGTVIGRYKLLEEIGEGGFGIVYMAEQLEPVQRKVALKIVKAGMDTRAVVARFEAERQALALMDHPNIAHVLDAGATETGRPYFVMELVRGIPITEFCDQQRLTPDERLELFTTVCRAVQHAHQKGIIHRDLKPTNVLVTLHDGAPVPKVIDFGVAKALGQKLTEKTLFTGFAQMVGTPAYMSPEQAELSGLDVDTRSDIYSLGVLLYELLTGVTPLDREDLSKAALEEVCRMIRETEPPKPSTRLRTLGEKITEVASHRHIEAPRLIHILKGDLDWIVMKCLEKDRRRRYETANGVAMDVQRHLNDEPVQARRAGALYRVRKFVRRHRTAVALAVSVTVALIAGLAAALIGFTQARWERDRAVAAEERAEDEARKAAEEAAVSAAVNTFLLHDLLGEASPYREPERDIKLRTLVDRAAQKAGERFIDQPLVELHVRLTMFRVYWGLGELDPARDQLEQAKAICLQQRLSREDLHWLDVRYNEGLLLLHEGRSAEAQEVLKDLLAIQRQALGAEHCDTLLTMLNLANACLEQGGPAEAQEIYEELLSIQRRVFCPEHLDTQATMHNLANAYLGQGIPTEAQRIYEELLPIRRQVLGPEHPSTLATMNNLANALRDQGKPAEAQEIYEEVLPIRRRVLGPEHPDTLGTMHNLAAAYSDQAKPEAAQRLYEEILPIRRRVQGSEHPSTLRTMHNLANAHLGQERAAQAQELYEEILPIQRRVQGPEHPETLATMQSLANAFSSQGKPAAAQKLLEQILPIQRRVEGPEHPDTLATMNNLANARSSQGRPVEAQELHEQVLPMRRRVLGPEHPDTLMTMYNLANAYSAQEKRAEAQELFEAVLPVQRRVLGPERPETLWTMNNLALIYSDEGKPAEAKRLLEEAVPNMRRVLGPEHPDTLGGLYNLALAYSQQGRPADAQPLFEELLPIMRRVDGAEHPDVLDTMHRLAHAYSDQGRHVKAGQLHEELVSTQRRVAGPEHPDTLADMHCLAHVYSDLGRHAEARKLHEEVVSIQRRVAGPEHPDMLAVSKCLAYAYREQGEPAKAQELLEEVLPIMRRVLGPEHPDTLAMMHCLGHAYSDLGRPAEARRLHEDVISIRRRVLGPEHPSTLSVSMCLAYAYREQGMPAEAEKLLEEILPIQRRVLGPDHPDTLETIRVLEAIRQAPGRVEKQLLQVLEEQRALARDQDSERGTHDLDIALTLLRMADAVQAQGRPDEADAHAAEAAQCITNGLARLHRATNESREAVQWSEVAGSLGSLGTLCRRQNRPAQAEALWREEIAIRRKISGDSDAGLAHRLHAFARVLLARGKLEEAATAARDALDLGRRLVGSEHLNVAHSLICVAEVFEAEGNCTEAEAALREALAIRRKALGDEHPDVAESLSTLAVTLRAHDKLEELEEVCGELFERGDAGPLNNLAWRFAASPDPDQRHGPWAVRFAEQAVAATGRTNALYLDTLAAALAEAGDFPQAVRIQKEAIALIENPKQREGFQSRLRLYEAGEPYHWE